MALCILGFPFIIISSVALLPTLEAVNDCVKDDRLLVPVYTPTDENDALALEVVGAYAQYLKGAGAKGVIVAATTGEGPTLNVSDNKRLLDAWMEAAKPLDLIVVSSVGGVPLPDTLEMARYSAEIGVDVIAALPEVFFKPQNVEELVFYIELIYLAAPHTDLLYDDNFEFTGVSVNIVTLYDLLSERIPTFKGMISNSFENLLLLRTKPRGQQKLYASNYFYLASEVCIGFNNYALAEFNFFPRLIIEIIRNRGNMTRSTNLYQRLLDLIEVITTRGEENYFYRCSNPGAETRNYKIAAEKVAMELITGIRVGPARRPIIPLNPGEEEALRQKLLDENIKLAQRYYD